MNEIEIASIEIIGSEIEPIVTPVNIANSASLSNVESINAPLLVTFCLYLATHPSTISKKPEISNMQAATTMKLNCESMPMIFEIEYNIAEQIAAKKPTTVQTVGDASIEPKKSPVLVISGTNRFLNLFSNYKQILLIQVF